MADFARFDHFRRSLHIKVPGALDIHLISRDRLTKPH
jgi:hypothetical protein